MKDNDYKAFLDTPSTHARWGQLDAEADRARGRSDRSAIKAGAFRCLPTGSECNDAYSVAYRQSMMSLTALCA